jgi:hypothetical protein
VYVAKEMVNHQDSMDTCKGSIPIVVEGNEENSKKGPIKKKEKPMRRESALLREWTWSPTYHLAYVKTV